MSERDEHQEAIAALKLCLRLIDDMAPFVSYMALPDYALFNEAPIAARRVLERAASGRALGFTKEEREAG